jgi:hypothetical protein
MTMARSQLGRIEFDPGDVERKKRRISALNLSAWIAARKLVTGTGQQL